MSLTSIIFILILLIVSGVVAWVGDFLGRVLGKRRMVLFGLRPRKTSVLIAVITGMLITGLTILALAAANKSIRTVLIRSDEILKENKELELQRQSASMAVDSLKGRIQSGEKEIELQQSRIEGLTGQLSSSQDELISLNSQLTLAGIQLLGYKTEIAKLVKERDNIREEYQNAVNDKEAEIGELGTQLEDLNNEISERQSRAEELDRTIVKLNDQITKLREGEVKVYEGQQLAVFLMDTKADEVSLNERLVTLLAGIPEAYKDLGTGEFVLRNNKISYSSDSYIQAVQEIRGIPADRAVVIAYSDSNVFGDEPVPLRLEITGYYKVYIGGAEIFKETFEKPEETAEEYRATMARFFEDARNFLVSQRNIIPASSGEVIELSIDDLLGLSEKLSSIGFPVELRMVALTDIYKTDFLVYGERFSVEMKKVTR